MKKLNRGLALVAIGTLVFVGACADKSVPPPAEIGIVNYVPFTTVQQKRWALATCAVLTQSNGMDHNLLGGCEKTAENTKIWQGILRDWWGISDRASLLGVLKWTDDGGQRKAFRELGVRIAALSEKGVEDLKAESADDEARDKIRVVMEYSEELGEKGLFGWDYARYVSLCGWGYITGYLTEDEAWQLITPAARKLQDAFGSWEELGRNHIIGREFWSLKHTKAKGAVTQKAFETLLADPASPWVNIPWDLPLSPQVPPVNAE